MVCPARSTERKGKGEYALFAEVFSEQGDPVLIPNMVQRPAKQLEDEILPCLLVPCARRLGLLFQVRRQLWDDLQIFWGERGCFRTVRKGRFSLCGAKRETRKR